MGVSRLARVTYICCDHDPTWQHFCPGYVVSRKRNVEGNIIWHAHDNPILDSQLYVVDFADSEVTILAANAIAKAMYAQCGPDGNE